MSCLKGCTPSRTISSLSTQELNSHGSGHRSEDCGLGAVSGPKWKCPRLCKRSHDGYQAGGLSAKEQRSIVSFLKNSHKWASHLGRKLALGKSTILGALEIIYKAHLKMEARAMISDHCGLSGWQCFSLLWSLGHCPLSPSRVLHIVLRVLFIFCAGFYVSSELIWWK